VWQSRNRQGRVSRRAVNILRPRYRPKIKRAGGERQGCGVFFDPVMTIARHWNSAPGIVLQKNRSLSSPSRGGMSLSPLQRRRSRQTHRNWSLCYEPVQEAIREPRRGDGQVSVCAQFANDFLAFASATGSCFAARTVCPAALSCCECHASWVDRVGISVLPDQLDRSSASFRFPLSR